MSKSSMLALAAVAVTGICFGAGVATFNFAGGGSYLSTDPKACANCHIMQSQFDSWQTSSHHTSATCVDCHMPATFPENYFAKVKNGWNHSKAFTLQNFHEPILVNDENQRILQANCLRCHGGLVHAQVQETAPSCARCHFGVGHGERTGLGGPLGPVIGMSDEDARR